MEPGSCEDFHGGRQACWDGFQGKAVSCVFLLEDFGCGDAVLPSCNGFLHQDSSKIATTALAPACLISIHTQMLALAARISKRATLAPAGLCAQLEPR